MSSILKRVAEATGQKGVLTESVKAKLSTTVNPGRSSYNFMMQRHAGVVVTQDNALTYSAVWRCVNLISQSIGALPWQISERSFDNNGRKSTRRLLTHPASNMLDLQACSELSAQHWRETVMAWALTWGNGYAEIERDLANRPIGLWLIEPDRCNPDRDNSGRLVYDVSNGSNGNSVLNPSDMFHLRGLGFDGMVGYSVIGMASRSIGLGLATEEFGANFFGNGAHVGGVFEHPSRLGDTAIDHLKESITERQGGKNQLSPMILEEGMKYTPTSIPPNDAQFLETRKFNIAEIARWYGVPLHKLHEMDKSSFNNIEHQSIEYVQDALVPWVKRLETEANIKVVSKSNRGRHSTKLNLNSLLRGDMKARGEHYKTMSGLGAYNVNDILELEDRNPIGADGEKRLVQLNLTTLDKVGEENVTVQTKIPGAPDGEEGEEDKDEETRADIEARKAAREILVRSMDRCIIRETHRATDALKRYVDDRSGLLEWMDNFYNQHKNYMSDQMIITTKTLTIDEGVFNAIIENSIYASRIEILNAFDESIDLEFSGDAETWVNNLIEENA